MTGEARELDFDSLSALAVRDPAGFESARLAVIERAIDRAPARRQQRLRCLQWRIDQICRLSGTPLAACMSISEMMWERVLGSGGLLEQLKGLQGPYTNPRRDVALERDGDAKVVRLRPDS